jgi:hypothetical protein
MSEITSTDNAMTKLANPEDRPTVRQYYSDTDSSKPELQDTYSRVAFKSDDDGGNHQLILEQVQDKTEIIKISHVIGSNPQLREYLDGKGMIWYCPEEEAKLQKQEKEEAERSGQAAG